MNQIEPSRTDGHVDEQDENENKIMAGDRSIAERLAVDQAHQQESWGKLKIMPTLIALLFGI
jgi:hypothetical protein